MSTTAKSTSSAAKPAALAPKPAAPAPKPAAPAAKPAAPAAKPAPSAPEPTNDDSDDDSGDENDDPNEGRPKEGRDAPQNPSDRVIKLAQNYRDAEGMKSGLIYRVRLIGNQRTAVDADEKLKAKELLATNMGGVRVHKGAWFFRFKGPLNKDAVHAMNRLFGAPVPDTAVTNYILRLENEELMPLIRSVVKRANRGRSKSPPGKKHKGQAKTNGGGQSRASRPRQGIHSSRWAQ